MGHRVCNPTRPLRALWKSRSARASMMASRLNKLPLHTADGDPRCALTGNWTDIGNRTRIEIFQPPDFSYLSWRSSRYHGAFSDGRTDPPSGGQWDHTGWLMLYEDKMKHTMTIGKSLL